MVSLSFWVCLDVSFFLNGKGAGSYLTLPPLAVCTLTCCLGLCALNNVNGCWMRWQVVAFFTPQTSSAGSLQISSVQMPGVHWRVLPGLKRWTATAMGLHSLTHRQHSTSSNTTTQVEQVMESNHCVSAAGAESAEGVEMGPGAAVASNCMQFYL